MNKSPPNKSPNRQDAHVASISCRIRTEIQNEVRNTPSLRDGLAFAAASAEISKADYLELDPSFRFPAASDTRNENHAHRLVREE